MESLIRSQEQDKNKAVRQVSLPVGQAASSFPTNGRGQGGLVMWSLNYILYIEESPKRWWTLESFADWSVSTCCITTTLKVRCTHKRQITKNTSLEDMCWRYICLCIIIIYHVHVLLGPPSCGCGGLHKRLQRLHHDGHVRPEIRLVLHTQRRHCRHLKHRNSLKLFFDDWQDVKISRRIG